jgi:hypothetical protein
MSIANTGTSKGDYDSKGVKQDSPTGKTHSGLASEAGMAEQEFCAKPPAKK